MRRGALSLSQVLEEEYEYVSGNPARCPEGERDCWLIRPHEVISATSFFDRIEASEGSSRFAPLRDALLGAAAQESEDALRVALADALNELLRHPALPALLLGDEELSRAMFGRPDRCAALLELPMYRSALMAGVVRHRFPRQRRGTPQRGRRA
jgi:hypothetical protein